MKGKAVIPLVLGLGIGLAAVKVGIDAVKNAKGAGPAQETVRIVRAKVDLNPHQEIQKDMVELVELAANSTLVAARERITSLENVVGRVTGKSVPQNSPVLLSMLAPPGTRPGMVGRIPEGFRAVAVKIDEVTGVAFQIKPGDWVDVIVVMEVERQGQTRGRRESVAEVILQHVQVAAIGRDVASQPTGRPSQAKPAKTATLFVAQADVPKLHLAAIRGKITLAMRGDEDDTSGAYSVLTDTEAFKSIPDPDPKPATPVAAPTVTLPSKPAVAQTPARVRRTHSVTVTRGTTGSGAPSSVEFIEFEDVNSSTVINANASSTRGRSRAARRPQSYNRNVNRRESARRPRNVPDSSEDDVESNADVDGE